MSANGDFIVVWQSEYEDGSSLGIAGQKFLADGMNLGSNFLANEITTGIQSTPKVAMDDLDNFIVVWTSDQDTDQNGIGLREFQGGSPLGEEFINEIATGNQDQPDITRDSTSDDYLVFWRDQTPEENLGAIPIKVQGKKRKPFGGEEGGFPVGTFNIATTGTDPVNEGFPNGEYNDNGNFIVVYQRDSQSASGSNVYAQIFNPDATAIGSEFQVNTYTSGYQGKAHVDIDNSGNFVIVWRSVISSGVREDIRARVGSIAAGGPVGDEFQINELLTYDLGNANVAMDENLRFIVVWHSSGSVGDDNSSLSIQSRGFEATCVAFDNCLFYDGFESGDLSAWSNTVP